MEDEDGESVLEMWNIFEDQQLKGSTLSSPLKCPTELFGDHIEEDFQSTFFNSASAKEISSIGAKIVYKGFKKRLLAQSKDEEQLTNSNALPKNSKDKRIGGKRGKITEYAQYLGLQPAPRSKCTKCQTTNFGLTKKPQCMCNSAMTPIQGSPSTSDSSTLASNFKITRKVYLCAACGTYFENWNLFLHMRDIHKRHICLFCLGMFGQAERLSYHLAKKHSVPEMEFSSVEDFYNTFKGSCYLVCCTCEKVFSETDNFYNHFCSPLQTQNSTTSMCTLCRQTGSHASTCSLSDEQVKDFSLSIPVESGSLSSPEKSSKTLKKLIRNNRAKSVDDSLFNSHQRLKKSDKQILPVDEVIPTDILVNEDSLDDSPLQNSSMDTVSETIMEVSRYIDDSGGDEVDETEDKNKVEMSIPIQDLQVNDESSPYDSVTQTIMEVSLCSKDKRDKEQFSCENFLEVSENTEEELEEDDAPVSDARSDLQEFEMEEAVRRKEKNNTANDTRQKTESEVPTSPMNSPINRSLFSPQHEPQTDLELAEEPEKSGEDKQTEPESQSSVFFNAVPSSDRSLVIKICTNKNSQYTIANADIKKDEEETKESEENNNGEEKTESMDRVDNSTSNHEDGSDSDSLKLAVVDSIVEEDAAEVLEAEANKVKAGDEEVQGEIVIDGEAKNLSIVEPVESKKEIKEKTESDGIVLAGEDVPSLDLNVEGTLDSTEIEDLLKRCIEVASPICVYCNHARHIAVNGNQLSLHMLAEHRFQPQHPAIIIQVEQFAIRVKKSLQELQNRFFNLDSYTSTKGTYNVPESRSYECFHCRFHSAVHKELYLHNRKMHQKTILICIMCKSTFYSYSELLCHLCPGVYLPNINIKYRCCLCPADGLPSAFRLMVHLRKRHHACDVCLESTGNQQRLSNHVWKHKLHHLCYRCGIAYRNKPDITKHLFWKHGTESVLCKKCLQKKWPHIYHFCIPPTAFVCEECGSSFTRAVALKVHKRLHTGDLPHSCPECPEKFISKRILARHELTHKESQVIELATVETTNAPLIVDEDPGNEKVVIDNVDLESKETKEQPKKVVDVYDLPPLNLSSESDTDSDNEKEEKKENKENKSEEKSEEGKEQIEEKILEETPKVDLGTPGKAESPRVEVEREEEEEEKNQEEARIIDGIWENFKSYAQSVDGVWDNFKSFTNQSNQEVVAERKTDNDLEILKNVILADHDYCVVYDKEKKLEVEEGTKEQDTGAELVDGIKTPLSPQQETEVKKKLKTPKKKKRSNSSSSSSSSDSDSSSCSCGTNCSCSSSSSGSSSSSSSSSDSDSSSESSPKKLRKEKKKEKEEKVEIEEKKESITVENGVVPVTSEEVNVCPPTVLRESDLETDETDTDEDFYDEHPQQLANKLLAEKRNQLLLLAAVAPASTESSISLNNGIDVESIAPSPVTLEVEQSVPRKKVKTKKRRKMDKKRAPVESIKLNIPKSFYQKNLGFSASPTVMTMQCSRSSTPKLVNDVQEAALATPQGMGSGSETENKRSSKRKRVPKKFYGDSSEDESEKPPVFKWRKAEPSFPPLNVTAPAQASVPSLRLPLKPPPYRPELEKPPVPAAVVSATDSEGPAESSSDTSGDSENETPVQEANVPLQRSDNLYCYCQCPYDEVSEMIACDGNDCKIEWFHFECVGIMVPPKGKWYCPDCRKRLGIVQNEDFLD
ncbi:uncharacterized protein [Prorops nasuta]|uniref:uncharacterized protein n=1 Tax=Prorops nasuta TaxID=863751 RepID=UPI0034CDEA33